MIVKIYNYFYVLFTKIFYFRRLKINGKIKSKSFLKFEIAKNSFLHIKGDLELQKDVLIAVRKNAYLTIGKNCFFNRGCSIVSRERIIIGDNCLFGEDVKIYDNNHKVANEEISRNEYITERVVIEDDCWIANSVNILKGSYIPSKSVIGSMSLVNKKLDKSGIYAGIPVKYIKSI